MQTHRGGNRFGIGLLILAFLIGSASPASAIVINDTAGSSAAVALGDPYTAVIELFVGGSFCSGALIDATHVLTAQHCTFGASTGSMSVHFHHLDNDGGSDAVYSVTAKSEVNATNVLTDGTDLAILTLSSPAPVGVTPMPIALSNPVGVVADTVGYGYNGIGSSGHGFGADGRRWAAENVIDSYGAALHPPGTPGTSGNIFNTDFDNETGTSNTLSGLGSSPTMLPNEGTTAPGDSGGPLVVDGQIVGILSGGTTATSVYGDISWWTGTFPHISWIQANAPGATFGTGVIDTPSNASFSSSVDLDVLNIDFGSVAFMEAVTPADVDITNFAVGGTVAALDLLSVAGSGDTSVLTTDVAPFVDLLPGFTNSFSASVDTSQLGTFAASYDLSFTDELGTNQTLTINMSAEISNDDPAAPDLVYDAQTGDVYLDPRDTGTINLYVLRSDDAFLPANHTPVLGGVATSVVGEISEASLSPISTPMGIGQILPSGLTLVEVFNTLTTRDVTTGLGQPALQFDVQLACRLGDADCDGDIDISGDILPAFSNFTGPGTVSKTRAQGDVEAHPFGDGDVDVSDLLIMLSEFTGPLDEGALGPPAAAGDSSIPDLIYDPATGEVVLDPDGSTIIGYSLQNLTNSFLPGNHTAILAGVTTALTSQIEEAALAPGSGSIGFVFPTGLDLAGLTALLSVNQVSRFLGAPLVPFDLVVLGATPVPESSSFALASAALAGLLLVRRRRRRAA
ncbi:MAG: hypothetical protein DWQ31_11530 [Planctomycetota bacterium]|nr:MAG: hypothetical protein DWQ31_12570 [Planctomycetota bacterium]REJ67406.1 MAG: hypothetical protein DWQ31_11530 [Planctomycetota bacterium]REJ89310.1 MAG: hypothetical protein DWQ35_18410 [Planctomycetota bacterium]REK22885.1 MAG: hypothetical protein DWQ42_16375 [Planctomycetota bacterium]REK37415.1 MAG: hypothetical protein DWQ46_22300 [Planctomycetota bacterium]